MLDRLFDAEINGLAPFRVKVSDPETVAGMQHYSPETLVRHFSYLPAHLVLAHIVVQKPERNWAEFFRRIFHTFYEADVRSHRNNPLIIF